MDINMDESNFRQTQPIMFDGMALPPFLPLLQDAKKRFEEIRNMEYRKGDIILAIYPKSGKSHKQAMKNKYLIILYILCYENNHKRN